MKQILFIISIVLLAHSYANAVVVVKTDTLSLTAKNGTSYNHTNVVKKNSIKTIMKKIRHFFTFDLSDPVDGWLSWAILCFAGAIGVGLVSWLLGGIYLLGFISSLLAIAGLVFFVVYIIKLVG